MPFSVVSLLLVFFQFFHAGGNWNTVHTNKDNASLIASTQSGTFYKVYSDNTFSYFEGIEEYDDKESVAIQGVAACFVTKHSSRSNCNPPLLNCVFNIHRARSDLNGRHLFLSNCNFRV